MRKQLRHVAQSRLCLLTAHRTPEEADLMHFGTLKLILMEQVSWRGLAAPGSGLDGAGRIDGGRLEAGAAGLGPVRQERISWVRWRGREATAASGLAAAGSPLWSRCGPRSVHHCGSPSFR